MRIYLAASSKYRFTARHLLQQIKEHGHEVLDWTHNRGYEDPESIVPDVIAEHAREFVFSCHGLIWLLSDNPSTGSGVEVGMAYALGLPVCVVPLGMEPSNEQIFAFLDGMEWKPTISSALNWIATETQKGPRPLQLDQVDVLKRVEEFHADRCRRSWDIKEVDELTRILAGIPF